jgi:hypothetical protein
VVTLSACGGGASRDPGNAASPALPQGHESVHLDPADFTVDITNPYWPMQAGDRWVLEEAEADVVERIEITVLDETREIANGIEARVVRDVHTVDGTVVEDTYDWYAQDSEGNIWYFGEDTTAYEDGQASTEGSWEAGVDGAQPGVVIPAEPTVGLTYRQEYLADEAEAEALVLSTDERVEGSAGSWTDVLMTRDTTQVEPDVSELKFFAPGVGPVLVLQTSGGTAREVLVETNRAD